MLQNLLVERFHMKKHHETKANKAYELVLAGSVPKLKETEMADEPAASEVVPPAA